MKMIVYLFQHDLPFKIPQSQLLFCRFPLLDLSFLSLLLRLVFSEEDRLLVVDPRVLGLE